MRTELRKPVKVSALAGIVAKATGMLDEHHVIAWSRSMHAREEFGIELARHLRGLPDTQTIVINGATVHDLDGFCRQLNKSMPEPVMVGASGRRRNTIDGAGSVLERLRERPSDPHVTACKRRYYIWRDADVLLRDNASLFGRLVDVLAGVAAEAEYASEDLLLIHRSIFIGGPALDVYADDVKGQFNSWFSEAQAGGKPLWTVVSGLARPPFARLMIR